MKLQRMRRLKKMEEKLHGPAAPRKKEDQKEKEGKGLRLRDSFSGSI